MKKKLLYAAGLAIIVSFGQVTFLQAQILKKILDNVKQSQQSKTSSSNKSENIDTSGLSSDMARVLGSFGKAAADNPNDTSSADLVTKALGNMIGGGGVTAADSAAAIKTFKTAKGGSGFYYETTTTTTNKNGTNKTVSKSYLSSAGEGRAEINLAALMGAKNSEATVVLSRAANPRYGMMLDASQKQYSLNLIDTSLTNGDRAEYTITKIGNEMVNGYNCTHAKVVTRSGKGLFASSSTMEVWTSPAVPGYSVLKKMMASQNITIKMEQELDKAGCGGSMVKMKSQGKDYSVDMELTSVESKTLPASLFMIPAGYTKSGNNLLISNLVQAGQKQ